MPGTGSGWEVRTAGIRRLARPGWASPERLVCDGGDDREYSPDLPQVPAYGSELNQVWTSLLDNAIDAVGRSGTITIRTRRDGDWAVVEVEDDGPGIPEAAKTRIFDPFFTTKEPGKGTGLGLSTCYSIVTDRHHGRISVDSEPGRTRFTVRLPLEAGDRESIS